MGRIGSRSSKAALLLAFALCCDRCARRNAPHVQPDSKSEAAIRAEARAFYRDLLTENTPALLNHFWPAKIAARWEPPFESRSPGRPALVAAAIVPGVRGAIPGTCATGEAAIARADLRVAGSWARALVPRCPEGDDELWFLEFDGTWKIVHLALARER